MMTDNLKTMTREIVNAQDSLVYILYTLGVSFTEMANLKISDCNFENDSIRLTEEDGKARTIQVTHDTMESIREASKQKRYWKADFSNYLQLADSNYVFKRAKSSNSIDPRVDHIMLETRHQNTKYNLLRV
ncbi:MAG: hypothetical protein ACOYVK_18780 [Bacillota bacterium]